MGVAVAAGGDGGTAGDAAVGRTSTWSISERRFLMVACNARRRSVRARRMSLKLTVSPASSWQIGRN